VRSSTRCITLAGNLALGLLLGSLQAQTPPVRPAESIPAVAFFQPADFTSPALSPDGRYIGFIGRRNGHACLFLLERTTGKIQLLFSPGKGHVERFWWKGDRRLLLTGQSGHAPMYFVEDLDSLELREIPALYGVPPLWINPLPQDVDHVVVAPTYFGSHVIEVDLRNNRRSRVEAMTGDNNHCVTSAGGELRAYNHRFADGWRIAWRASAKAAWHECKGEGEVPFRPVAMDADDRHLLVFAYDQGNTIALMRLDPDSDQRTLVVQYADRDVSELMYDPEQRAPTVVRSCQFGRNDLEVLDETARPFYATLTRSLPNTCNRWIGSSADGSLRIIHSWSGRDPGRYHLYDSNRNTLLFLGPSYLDLPPSAMCEVKPFTFQTRDAVSESGYVVLPPTAKNAPPPLLVIPMKDVGESADTGRDFYFLAQFFASRGFAVARFAVRGTRGFGRAFENAGDFQFAGRLVQDIEDGVNHLARTGFVDGKRVGILGWGASGLIALRTAASSPLFRAVAVFNSWASFDVDDVTWLTSSEAPQEVILEQLGGVRNAYKITHQLDPETFLQSLSAPTFLAYETWYGNAPAGHHLRGVFRRFKKPYEWFDLDTHLAELPKAEENLELYYTNCTAELYTKAVDFLKRNL
jgi:hypothetical protein